MGLVVFVRQKKNTKQNDKKSRFDDINCARTKINKKERYMLDCDPSVVQQQQKNQLQSRSKEHTVSNV